MHQDALFDSLLLAILKDQAEFIKLEARAYRVVCIFSNIKSSLSIKFLVIATIMFCDAPVFQTYRWLILRRNEMSISRVLHMMLSIQC